MACTGTQATGVDDRVRVHTEEVTLGGVDLRRLLERKKEQHYFTVPWPVAAYDALAVGLR